MSMLSIIATYRLHYVVAAFFLTGCSDSDEPVRRDDLAAERGYVKGLIKDSKGNPLPGVSVIVDNTVFANTYVNTITDEHGSYRVKVPATGVWVAYAKHFVSYESQDYYLYLRPDNAEGFVSEDGAIRNFTWTLTGKKPLPLSGNFGGSVQVEKGVGSMIYDPDKILFTMTPTKPLIDGTAGQVISLRCDENNRIEDVPIGTYRIKADYYAPTGVVPLTLSDFFTQGDFVRELELTFRPSTHVCDNCMVIQYKE